MATDSDISWLAYWSLVGRGVVKEAKGFVREHLLIDFLVVLVYIVLAFVLVGIPETRREQEYMLFQLLAFLTVLLIALVALVMREPWRLHRDLASQLSKFSRTGIQIISGPPSIHSFGSNVYLLIPRLEIQNHDPRDADFDLAVHITLPDKPERIILPLDGEQDPTLLAQLESWQRAGVEILEQMKVPGGGRVFGHAIVRLPTSMPIFGAGPNDITQIEKISLNVDDGVANIVVTESEIWPNIWPAILNAAKKEGGGQLHVPDPKDSTYPPWKHVSVAFPTTGTYHLGNGDGNGYN